MCSETNPKSRAFPLILGASGLLGLLVGCPPPSPCEFGFGAPTADAGADQNVETGDRVTLNGNASTDPDGDALTYQWQKTSGPAVGMDNPGGAMATFVPQVDGVYVFALTVSDGCNSDEQTVHITVGGIPRPGCPLANAGPDFTVNEEERSICLTGINSADPNGSPLAFSWTQLSGPDVSLSNPFVAEVCFDAPDDVCGDQSLVLELTVVNEAECRDKNEVVVTVLDRDGECCTSDADCDDQRPCTEDTCDAAAGSCVFTLIQCPGGQTCDEMTGECDEVVDICMTDADCDDDLFCNGVEFCENRGCLSSENPCAANETCDEDENSCMTAPCDTDADCNDDLFCNGTETCVAGECQAGAAPCANDETSDEDSDTFTPPIECLTNANCDVIEYLNDFEGEVGPEWSSSTTDVTPVGGRRFLGQFGNGTVTLTLPVPQHDRIDVSFELFILNSWDGHIDGCCTGPDLWHLSVGGGAALLNASFSNVETKRQTYPDMFPGPSNSPLAGASEIDTLGFPGAPNFGDSVYVLSFSFAHSGETLVLSFRGSGLQGLSDESWGIDNVVVSATGLSQLGDTCDEENDACTTPECVTDADCDDADECTTDTCELTASVCTYEDVNCDDELFCTGVETCESATGCVDGDEPCDSDTETCDEDNDECVGCATCATDDDCTDDGVFCNGTEICDTATSCCTSTGDPCADNEECDEDAAECPLPPLPPPPLACGDLIPGTIEAAGEADFFTFGAQAGDEIFLTLVQTAGFGYRIYAQATLFDPMNIELLTFNANSTQRFMIEQSGSYVVRLRTSNLVSTGSYNLGLECLLPQP